MRKWLAAILSLFCLTAFFSGCYAEGEKVSLGEDSTPTSTTTQETTTPDLPESTHIPDDKTVIDVPSISESAFEPDIEALSEYASTVLIGTVVGHSYTPIQGNAWTVVDITTDTVLKGNVQIGQALSVYFVGGYIPLAEQIAYYDDAFRYENMTEEEIQNTVLHEVVDGEATPPQTGKQYLFYLVQTPDDSPLPQNVYERIGGKAGQLEMQSPTVFARTVPETAQTETYTIEQIEAYLD